MYNTFEMETRIPLAERMRPQSFDEFVGQEHIVGKDTLLYRAIKYGTLGSCIFFGPPGTGKTTLGNIIAKTLRANYVKLNAVTSGVNDAKMVIERAKTDKAMLGKDTYLILDECHRWNKAQSDCVLEAIENGDIYLIGTTTENPYTSMTRAIVSRCRIFEFKPLSSTDIVKALKNAVKDKEKGLGNLNIEVEKDAYSYLAFASAGDLRNALNSLELAYIGDAIYEVYIRKYNMQKNIRKVNNLQKNTIKYVNAFYQAAAIKYLLDNNILSNEEINICKTARNYKTNSKAKHADILTYKHATSFEALIGYLYLENKIERISELIKTILEEVKC